MQKDAEAKRNHKTKMKEKNGETKMEKPIYKRKIYVVSGRTPVTCSNWRHLARTHEITTRGETERTLHRHR